MVSFLVRQDQVRRGQAVGGHRRTLHPDLVQQAVERGREGGLVVVLHGGLELGVQAVQLGGVRVLHLELALAEDPDDHYPSPSCGSAGRSAAGMAAG